MFPNRLMYKMSVDIEECAPAAKARAAVFVYVLVTAVDLTIVSI